MVKSVKVVVAVKGKLVQDLVLFGIILLKEIQLVAAIIKQLVNTVTVFLNKEDHNIFVHISFHFVLMHMKMQNVQITKNF